MQERNNRPERPERSDRSGRPERKFNVQRRFSPRPSFTTERKFIIGRQPLIESLESGANIEKILIQKNAQGDGLVEIKNAAREKNIPVQLVPIEKLNEFSSDCNAEYELVQFSNTRNTDGKNYMYGFYYMFFNFGIIPQQLIFTIREFTNSYLTALREKDKDDLYFG